MTKLDAALRRIAFILFLLVAGLVVPAFAQGVGQVGPANGMIAEQQRIIDGLKTKIDDLAAKIEAGRDDDTRLVEIRLQLDDVGRALLQSGLAFRPRLAEINAKLDQLGAAPAEGQPPEPDIVTSERQSLLAEKAEINAVLSTAESLSVQVNDLVNHIAQLRRDLFARLLTHRYDLDYTLAGEVLDAYRTESAALRRTLWSWLNFVLQFKFNSLLGAAFFALCAAVPLVGGRRLFGRLIRADPPQEQPSYLSRLAVAFWSTLLPSISFALFLGVTYFCFDYYNVLRGDIGEMMLALFYAMALVFFVTRLASAILAPGLPNWRLVPMETSAARWLFWLIVAMAVINGIDYLFNSVYEVMGSPLALTVAESLIATVLVGILVISFGFTRPFRNDDGTPRAWPRFAKYIFIALGVVTALSALLGYVGLAKFLSQQIVITGAILAMMYIGFLTAGAVAEEGALSNTALGKRVQRRLELDDTTLDQLGLAASIVLYILVGLVGVPLTLLQWGFQWGDVRSWIYSLGAGVKIGNVIISLTGILSGVVVFFVVYLLTRWFKGWLDGSVMARGRIDAGVRNSIRTAVGYAGILLAALLGVSAAGLDLSNFALIAGGLSLGLGFGLQNVVSNFVSGLILLAERPFKVGDWVVAGDNSGIVKKISVRATEIETFHRQSMIVPNSVFINSSLGNWTHRNKLGRVDVKVGVAYGSDARRAAEIMNQVMRSHPMVLKNPEPFVVFLNFGPAALEFELRFFLADILAGVAVQNDIRFAILEAFDKERIEIPWNPRAVDPRYAESPASDEPAKKPARRSSGSKNAPAKGGRARRPDPDTPDIGLEGNQ